MLSWLSQRLGMPYVSGPTADPLWGNAILSRYPIGRSENRPLPPQALLVKRGYLDTDIDLETGSVRLIATHLHHLSADSQIRVQQISAILDGWGGTGRTIILGDLNATPDSPEIQMLVQAGLVDVSTGLEESERYTFYAESPNRQIDYIWITPDLIPSDPETPKSTASDHLPVVVTITLR